MRPFVKPNIRAIWIIFPVFGCTFPFFHPVFGMCDNVHKCSILFCAFPQTAEKERKKGEFCLRTPNCSCILKESAIGLRCSLQRGIFTVRMRQGKEHKIWIKTRISSEE